MPLYDFKCANGHTHEVIRSYELRDTPWGCLTCNEPMQRVFSASHVPPDGVYSYSPNVGDPERFERQRHAIKTGQKVIERGHTKLEKAAAERAADQATSRRNRA